jgi:hypothetical protein
MPLQTLLEIPYGVASGRLLSLDAVRPEHDTGSALPVVLWLHGGGWYSGNKRNAISNHMFDDLVHSGFVLASAEYRLSDEAPFPAQIHVSKPLSAGCVLSRRFLGLTQSLSQWPGFRQADIWQRWRRPRVVFQN